MSYKGYAPLAIPNIAPPTSSLSRVTGQGWEQNKVT